MTSLTYSKCTPFNTKGKYYSVFKSTYKNIRYRMGTNQTYTVGVDDVANLPGISYKLYGTVDLWRVILEFNGLSDPINDLYVGQVLQIPSKTDVLSILSSSDSTSVNNQVTI